MAWLLRLTLPVLLAAFTAAAQGDWIAVLEVGPVKLRLALHLTDGAGTADSIDQDAFDLPLSLRRNGRALRFEIAKLGGRFDGEFAENGQVLEGVWTQRKGRLPLRFERGNIRPQEPAPPYPYDSQDLTVRSGRVRLAGTLTLPRTAGPHPAVVLITGSGPQDRNDTVSGHRPFLTWADRLTRLGFAVLRLDDRGVGGSTGRLLQSNDEDFAGDSLAAVALLRQRKEIDPRRIGLLGHSEGAVVASIAAARSKEVAFVVLLAGPAIPGEQLQILQAERIGKVMGIPEGIAHKNLEVQRKLFALSRSGARERQLQAALIAETSGLRPEEAAIVRGQLGTQIGLASSPWFRFVLGYDPKAALEQLRCPALAIYGSLDLQVPADSNAPAMERALGRQGRVVTIAGLNHMLQHAQTGSPLEYAQIEETVAEEVLELVERWLGQAADLPR